MKISKAVLLAVSMAGVLTHLPGLAKGNAHQFPVVPKAGPAKPVEAASTKAIEASSSKPVEAAAAKSSEAVVSKPVDAVSVKPSDAASAKTADVVPATTPEKPASKFVIVTRFGPLSDKDTLEVVPDLNRGRGKSR